MLDKAITYDNSAAHSITITMAFVGAFFQVMNMKTKE